MTPAEKEELLNDVKDLLSDMLGMLFPNNFKEASVLPLPEAKDVVEYYTVSSVSGDKLVTFTITPKNSETCGIILGRKGFTINSIRHYLAALGSMYGLRFNVWVEQPPLLQMMEEKILSDRDSLDADDDNIEEGEGGGEEEELVG